MSDWHDEGAGTSWQRAASMAPDATLLVIGPVVDPRNGKQRLVKLLDQENAVLLPGRFRTRDELQSLLASAGFDLVGLHPTAYSDLQIAEARPAAAAAGNGRSGERAQATGKSE